MQTTILADLTELEAIAALMEQRAIAFKDKCRKAREKMAGVSTPATNKGLTVDEIALIRLRHRKRKIKKA